MKAKVEYVDGIRFDSRLEAEMYRMLSALYGKNNVIAHSSTRISSEAYYLPKILHKVDFLVNYTKGCKTEEIYIEVKGTLEGSWKGRAEYISILHHMNQYDSSPINEGNYLLFVGSGSLGLTEVSMPFAYRFPRDLSKLEAIIANRWRPDF